MDKPKILIIDDLVDYLHSLENALSYDFDTVIASSLKDGQEKMTKQISLALVDIRLKEDDPENKDGILFLKWCKENFPNIPVVMMSKYKDFDVAVECLNLGAKKFLKKPINIAELKDTIKTIIKNEKEATNS